MSEKDKITLALTAMRYFTQQKLIRTEKQKV